MTSQGEGRSADGRARAVRPLALAAAALAIVSAVALGVVDRDDDGTSAGGIPFITVPEGSSGDVAFRDPPPITSTTLSAGEAATLGAPSDPGAPTPPRPGRYDFERTAGNRTARATTTVRAGGSQRQVHTFSGPQNTFENTLLWSAGGVEVVSSSYSFGGDDDPVTASCEWLPALREYAFPLRDGATWTIDSSCTLAVQGQAVTIRRTGRAEVDGLARIKVGGDVLDVWVVRRSEESRTTSGRGTLETRTESLEWFSPRHGLRVKLDASAAARSTAGGRSRTSESTVSEQLLNLAPR